MENRNGRWRFAMVNGEPVVVGRGHSLRCKTIGRALDLRDRLQYAERERRLGVVAGRGEAGALAHLVPLTVGARVIFRGAGDEPAIGRVVDLGATGTATVIGEVDGHAYRRRVADLEAAP